MKVNYIQWTGDNSQEIAKKINTPITIIATLFGGKNNYREDELTIEYNNHTYKMEPYDYLIIFKDGSFETMSKNHFEEMFQELILKEGE